MPTAFRRSIRVTTVLFSLSLSALTAPGLQAADTLETTREGGVVRCGVSQGLAGFSAKDDNGAWAGFDVDLCRATAAAALGDASKTAYTPLSAARRFDALRDGEVDVLARNSTWTLSRDGAELDFVGVNFFDGQGFMVRTASGVQSVLELEGKTVCYAAATTHGDNLAVFFAENAMPLKAVEHPDSRAALKAYEAGECDVYSADRSGLAARRLGLALPGDHVVLDDIISKEPLGPVVRHDDSTWADIVRWSLNCMLEAEELGVDSAMATSATSGVGLSMPVAKLLGFDPAGPAEALGLDAAWCRRVIAQVGNYHESYERNVGEETPVGIARGLNALWGDGGILYSPPFR